MERLARDTEIVRGRSRFGLVRLQKLGLPFRLDIEAVAHIGGDQVTECLECREILGVIVEFVDHIECARMEQFAQCRST